MVYLGPSRGCNSCKRQRKKCDGTRPSCMRCIKANRACGGYEDVGYSRFRLYDTSQSKSCLTTARKCTMPKRVPFPGTDILPQDILPAETSQAESSVLALRAFFYDYCIKSTNSNLSRGYLTNLETLTCLRGPASDLVKACQAVSFATHGKPLNRPVLVAKAERLYHELLGTVAKSLDDKASADSGEMKIITILLGLHQMTMSNEDSYGSHEAHAGGLAALMQIEASPINFFKTSNAFAVPALQDQDGGLQNLLSSVNILWARWERLHVPEDCYALKAECIILHERFVRWESNRMSGFKPTTVGEISDLSQGSELEVGFWPGKVDTYFDLYVAGVWNIFRAARLLLLTLITKLSAQNDDCSNLIKTACCVTEDILASIPYHIIENLPDFLCQTVRMPANTSVLDPGKYLGGLLLIHPLYVVSEQKEILPFQMRNYVRTCLSWIGSNMGFGQATLFANTPGISRDFFASGCMIIWGGFLDSLE